MEEIEILEEYERIKIEEPPKLDKTIFLKNNGIHVDSTLANLKDLDEYDKNLNDFLINSSLKLHNIENYKLENNMQDFANEIASLENDFKNLGLTKLVEISHQQQLASKENNIKYIEEHFNELLIEYEKIINILKQYQDMY